MNKHIFRKRWGRVFRGVFAEGVFGNRVESTFIANWGRSEYALGIHWSWGKWFFTFELCLAIALLQLSIYPFGLYAKGR